MWLLIVGNTAADVHGYKTLTETLIFFPKRFLEIRLLVLRISALLRLLINIANSFKEVGTSSDEVNTLVNALKEMDENFKNQIN